MLWSEVTPSFIPVFAEEESWETSVYEEALQDDFTSSQEETIDEIVSETFSEETILTDENLETPEMIKEGNITQEELFQDEETVETTNNKLEEDLTPEEPSDTQDDGQSAVQEWNVNSTETIEVQEETDNLIEDELTITDNEEVFSQEFQLSISDNSDYVPGEVIVKYKDEIPQESSSKILARSETFFRNIFSNKSDEISLVANDLEIVDEIPDSTTVLIEIKDDKTVDETIELLQDDPRIEYVEPNYIHQMFDSVSILPVNDTRKSELNGLDIISWADAYMEYSWSLKSENTNVIVWVIDNGVNYYHPDLENSMWSPSSCKMDSENIDCNHWYDFLYDSPTPLPNISSHGTHVAWIIAAEINNGKGVIGVNPYAKVASLKAWNGAMLTSLAEIKAIRFAIENGIKVINASYGSEYESNAEKDAIQAFWKAGGLFIAAAGNEGINIDTNSIYPCAYDLDNIICVASIWNTDNISSFSNYWKTTVDIAAPWEKILSTSINEYQNEALFDQDFDTDCTTWGDTINNWKWGECRPWSNGEYSYKFTNMLTAPSINLKDKENVYLSLSVACNSSRGVNLDLEYSNDGDNYEEWLTISSVGAVGYNYSIGIDDKLYNENFSFRLKIQSPRNWLYCVVDNVVIYQDPYYSSNSERYVKMSWTSMATPFVSWLASLVWKLNPNLTYTEVRNIILSGGDELESLSTKTVTWKKINVLKTLNLVAIPPLVSPNWLKSSWDWRLEWNPIIWEWEIQYYYEVLSGDNNISWNTQLTWTTILNYETWNYEWTLKAKQWSRTSDTVTWYICKKPTLTQTIITWYECSSITWSITLPQDNCSSDYTLVWEDVNNNSTEKYAILNTTWELIKKAYLKNSFWEKTDAIEVKYIWNNAPIEFEHQSIAGFLWTTITSTDTQKVWNVIELFWASDGLCWSWTINVKSVYCNVWTWSLNWNILSVKAPSSSKGTAFCSITFNDDEWTINNASFTYKYNTKPVTTTNTNNTSSNNTSSNNTSSNNTSSNNTSSNNTSSNNTSSKNSSPTSNNSPSNNNSSKSDTKPNVEKTKKSNDLIEVEEPRDLILYSAPTENTIDFSWYDNSNKDIIRSNGYTVEMNNAYEFAHRLGITTTNSIENANMWWELTRIAMAKMLSQYAINVLKSKPDTLKETDFTDVDEKLNQKYDNWVKLAYQLGIMGVWIKRFRPYDPVTRAEFATALSRMLFWLKDGKDAYYTTHINKLFVEWIIGNKDPDLQELRGYVMLMLMRSAMNNK